MPVEKLKETLLNKIDAATEKAYGQLPGQLEIGFPPSTEMGHFAVGCFPLAKLFRRGFQAGIFQAFYPSAGVCRFFRRLAGCFECQPFCFAVF